jgi:hypothetical protein
MPRVLPKQARFRADQIAKSWQSFSYDDETGGHTIKSGVRLRGDHPAVQRCPWCFIADDQPDDARPSLYPDIPVETPMFDKPTKVRLKVRVLRSSMTYEPGTQAEFPPDVAEWLVTENFAEVA